MLVVRNPHLKEMIATRYSLDDVARIHRLLDVNKTLAFPSLPTGLYSAGVITSESAHTGYQATWVRDNVYIAYAHFMNGEHEAAARTATALCTFFEKQRDRFRAIIHDPSLASKAMNRPHVRFNGTTLEDITEKWPHAQNDALGYFVWLYATLARQGIMPLSNTELETVGLFPLYFRAIRYWQDEDSGHWEETRKVSASSIGAVLAGLRELEQLDIGSGKGRLFRDSIPPDILPDLISQGRRALDDILPAECVQPQPEKHRRHDAALLFLIYPLGVCDEAMSSTIIDDLIRHLRTDYGIKRYIGDSFWCTNYRRLPKEKRTIDYSEDTSARDALLVPGGEAHWCLFDPLLSAYYGNRFMKTHATDDLEMEIVYFNRSLGQITGSDCPWGEFKCPELYHWEGDRVEPSDTTPLLWTQANLWLALMMMEGSLRL
jgi:phosphorylase kinase alpha/beta subunit